jgi:hypothetical protein
MKASWITVALLGSALAVGCGDRTPENTETLEQTAPALPPDSAGQPGASNTAGPSPNQSTAHHQDDSAVVQRDTRPQSVPVAPRPAARPAPSAGPAATGAPAARNAAPAPASPPAARWREVTLPAGTAMPLELMTALSSETAKVETPVRARVRSAIQSDGIVVIPAGTILTGTVVDVERPGRVQGRARLAIRFDEAELDGAREDVRTNPITFEGEQTKGEDATKIAGGAVGGAIIGGILGGGDGAAKGAAIGGAAGTGAVLATRGRDVTLAAGTDIAATLASPVTIRAETR